MSRRFTLRGFRPERRGTALVLGQLESAVMKLLWSHPEQTVNDVEARLKRRRDIAHTTVLTTLDRLHRKGYVIREKQGKAFVYAPRYSPEEFEHGTAREVLGALLGQFTEPAISAFVDLVAKDPGTLDQLEALIREKRREQLRDRREL